MHPNQLSQYTKIIRYGTIILSLFLSAKTIEVYQNNLRLSEDINLRQISIKQLNDEISYSEKYISGYKSSLYAPIFVTYEKGILKNPGEYRIKFELRSTPNQQVNQQSGNALSPPASWNMFFSTLGERLKGKK